MKSNRWGSLLVTLLGAATTTCAVQPYTFIDPCNTDPGPGAPRIHILSPPNDEMNTVEIVDQGGDRVINLAVAVDNFRLSPPGTCIASDLRCGHVHINIDGDACNIVGQPYNNMGGAPMVQAVLSRCPRPTAGVHVIQLHLRRDNHDPVMPGVCSQVTVRTP